MVYQSGREKTKGSLRLSLLQPEQIFSFSYDF
jgi:hypothetical protein